MQDEMTRGVVSLVQWFIVVLIWQILLYGLGYVVLYVCSAGRWPRPEWEGRHDGHISFTGFCVIALAWTAMAIYNNLG